MWYGSSGPSSVHPVGLTGGYPQVCDNLRCARNVQASTQKRSSCTRFNEVCALEKKKASLSPRAPISVEVLPVVVASSPASPVCGLWGCVPLCCCYQPFSRLRWWFEGRLLGEVGVVSRCTPRTKENTTEPGDRCAPRSPTVAWSSKGANFTVFAHCNGGASDPNRRGHLRTDAAGV